MFATNYTYSVANEARVGIETSSERERIHILVPKFQGDSNVAMGVTNFLRLQVSATFQEAGTFTRAMMIFDPTPLAKSTHNAAVKRGLLPTIAAHFVLWGHAYSLVDGVAVQTKLSVTPMLTKRFPRPEVWSVKAPQLDGSHVYISVALPRETYGFSTILIGNNVAQRYTTPIKGMKIYLDPTWEKQIGTVGNQFRAHEYRNNAVKLNSNGVQGWVRLDFINEEENQVVEFVGSLIRICRGDWNGAEVLLNSLQNRKSIMNEQRTDIELLLGLVKEKQGQSGLENFRLAVDLSPFNQIAVSYLLLGQIAELQRSKDKDKQINAQLLMLRQDISRFSILFSPESRWLKAVKQFVDYHSL
ncbi:hypothetical protein ACK14S_08380 [Vibrio natriegens]